MSKKANPNTRPDPYPADVRLGSIRRSNDADTGALQKHERDLAKLDRCPREKGGRVTGR
jgi:hypothetical protein